MRLSSPWPRTDTGPPHAGQLIDAAPWADAGAEQRSVADRVADPGDERLIKQCLADLPLPRRRAQLGRRGREVKALGERVRPELGEGRVAAQA